MSFKSVLGLFVLELLTAFFTLQIIASCENQTTVNASSASSHVQNPISATLGVMAQKKSPVADHESLPQYKNTMDCVPLANDDVFTSRALIRLCKYTIDGHDAHAEVCYSISYSGHSTEVPISCELFDRVQFAMTGKKNEFSK